MAASLNPFLAEDDMIENEIDVEIPHIETFPRNDSREVSPDLSCDTKSLTLDHIATKLLKDNFVLTALEFHTELVESGRELPRLRDFFSNPANFERTKLDTSPPGLPRTSSVQTFDSLDFARYSDDGNQQENEKVAVLEFELRKAQDTIKSLRATLTRTAETELSSPDTPADGNGDLLEEEAMQPYEKRAINFLVNEYLLVHNYKLTSVTYAEENENQDFEDWDDVGLNMPKPPDLLHLFRNYGQHAIAITETDDKGVQITFDSQQFEETLEEMERLKLELNGRISELDDQVQTLSTENEFLSHQLKQLEREAEAVRALKQKSSTPAVSPIPTPSKHVPNAKASPFLSTVGVGMDREDGDGDSIHEDLGIQPLQEPNKTEASIDNREGRSPAHTDNPTGAIEADNDIETTFNGTKPAKLGTQLHMTTDEDREVNGTETIDSMKVEPGTELPSHSITKTFQSEPSEEADVLKWSNSWQTSKRKNCETFQKALLRTTFQVSQDNRIVSEVSKISDSNLEKVMLMLGRCLPHIVPNVLLAKREELIPVIICAATLHPEAKERDALLNILFNLIKKPDAEQRQMILTGCVAFAQHVGPERVESELLPQCWEQITHKFPERRLLVAEACGALAPYLPNEILSSLVLSMLQQMLDDDKEDEVREAVTRSLGLLMGFIDDSDKYIKGSELLYKALNDPSERVLAAVQSVLLPAFAMWSLELGCLETDLIQSFVDKLEYLVRGPQSAQASQAISSIQIDKQQFCLLTTTLQQLIPILFVSVITSSPFTDKNITVEEAQVITLSSRFLLANSELTDLSVVVGSADKLVRLVCLYEDYISEEWYEPWETFNWVAGELIPQLLNLTNSLDVSTPALVHGMARFQYVLSKTFGRTFTVTKIRPKFQTVLRVPEEDIDTLVASNQTALTKCTVPVYVAGVLGAFGHEEDCKQLHSFLLDLLCTLSLCQAPLHSLQAAISELCLNTNHHELLLTVLWEGVVHTSALVRSSAAAMFELLIKGVNEILVGTRVVPALVTLASDPEITVRIATVPAFGTILENVTTRTMLDKVYMQFQTFMDDPIYKDQHALHVTLIKTFARVGPNAEPKFRDEFLLPRLAVMAATNNHLTNETKKMDIALSLFEAYSALSCCFISEKLMQEVMVPGLRCLLVDLQQVAPDHVNVVASMIREFEDKMDASSLSDRSLTSSSGGGTPSHAAQSESKNKVLSRFKDMKDRASTSSNFQKIFGKKS